MGDLADATKVWSGPGNLEVGAVGGRVVIYIPPLDHHVAFSPNEAVQLATLILAKAKAVQMQIVVAHENALDRRDAAEKRLMDGA